MAIKGNFQKVLLRHKMWDWRMQWEWDTVSWLSVILFVQIEYSRSEYFSSVWRNFLRSQMYVANTQSEGQQDPRRKVGKNRDTSSPSLMVLKEREKKRNKGKHILLTYNYSLFVWIKNTNTNTNRINWMKNLFLSEFLWS